MAKKVEAFAARDGLVFATEGEADRHDRYLAEEARKVRLHNLMIDIHDQLSPDEPLRKTWRDADAFATHLSEFTVNSWPEITVLSEYFDDLKATYEDDANEQPADDTQHLTRQRGRRRHGG